MRGVAADGDAAVGPGAPPPLQVQVVEERRAVVEVAALDVALRRRLDELEREAVPDLAVGVGRVDVAVGELAAEPVELGRRVLGRRLGVDAARGLADEREPLLALAAAVGRDEVLLLAEQDLVRDVLDVGRAVRRERGVAREALRVWRRRARASEREEARPKRRGARRARTE